VSVKPVFLFFLFVWFLSMSHSASAAILPCAPFYERIFARCKWGVLVPVGAVT